MARRIELLAPAGDFASLKAAIASGADAVYLGGNAFSARAFAKNFDRDELQEAVRYAHLRNVKVHVTCNILYRDDELPELLDYIDFLYKIQVDAILIQDIGLLKLVRKMYPDLEVHVSTQMTCTSLAAVRYFEDLGVSRVVLAREESIENITHIAKNTPLEIEVFAHGAICVAYSGQCLMSSMIGKRSGNRGACAQPCRLPYQLKEDGKILNEKPQYMISPRDLCTIDHIDELIESGITSLKIEGRMKKPEYVAAVVSSYRKAIDHYYDHHQPAADEQDMTDMKQMFNRHYTSGYAFHDHKIVDGDFPGNRGMPAGEVIGYQSGKKRVRVRLTHTLKQGDSVLFTAIDQGRPINKMYINDRLVNHADPGDIAEIEFNEPVKNGEVRKTVSADLIHHLDQKISSHHNYRTIDFEVYAYLGAPLTLIAHSDHHDAEVTLGDAIAEASHSETSPERITQQLAKLGSSIYQMGDVQIYASEHINIPISLLNQARRNVISQLDKSFAEEIIHHDKRKEVHCESVTSHHPARYIAVVRTLRQLDEALDQMPDVYFYNDEGYEEACRIYEKHHQDVRIYLPRITMDDELKALEKKYHDVHHFIVNDYGAYRLFQSEDVIIGTGLNVFNHLSAASFKESVIASYECDEKAIQTMIPYNQEIILPIYGRMENMISEHCVISQYYYQKKVPHCNKCKGHSYELVDRRHVSFPVFTDDSCRNHILNSVPLYLKNHRQLNCSYMMMFTDEKNISDLLSELLNGHISDLNRKVTEGYF